MKGNQREMQITKRKIRLLILSVLIFSCIFQDGFSQPWLKNFTPLKSTGQTENFHQLQKAFEEYWTGKDINAKGIGYKPFKRWEWMMAPRVGDEVNRNQAIWDAYLETSAAKKVQPLGDWIQIGPKSPPTDLSTGQIVGAGRIDCIAFHPTDIAVFWIGSPTGGLWKTTDGGHTWNPLTDLLPSMGIADIAIHPQHPDTIYIATGDRDAGEIYSAGVLKSTDGGQTWNTTGISFDQSDNFVVTRLLLNPEHPDTLVAATNKGIYFMTGGGDQASMVLNGNFKDMEFKPGDPNTVYAASYSSGYSSVYKSTNGGSSFSISFNGVENSNIRRIVLEVTPAQPNWVYALCADKDNSAFEGLYRSVNSGDSWDSFTSTGKNLLGTSPVGDDTKGQGWYDLALAVSRTNPAEVYVGGINLWKTTNSGTSWDLVTYGYPEQKGTSVPYVHVDQHALEINPLTGYLFSGNDGGIYRSKDHGSSWTDLSNNLEILQIYRIGTSSTRSDLILMGSQDNSSIKLINSVFKVVIGGDGMECIVDYSDTNKLYVSSQRGKLKYSADGGKNFTSIVPDTSDKGAWITPYIMNPQNPDILYAGYSNLYMSRNRGQEWYTIASGVTGGNKYNALTMAPSDPNTIYAATKTQIWRTTDNGENWTAIKTGLPSGIITYIAVSQYDPGELWITMSNYLQEKKVYSSKTGGDNWTNYSTGLPNVPANCIVLEDNTNKVLYVGTDLGVFYRNKTMSQWESFSQGIPNVIVNELEIFYPGHKIRAGTYGRGLWESHLFQPDSLPLFANFTTNRYQGCMGGTFRFENKSVSNADSIHWIFSTDATPTFSPDKDTVWVVFSEEGFKKAELIAYRNHMADTISRPTFIKVNSSIDITLYSSAGKYFWRGDTTLLEANGASDYRWSPALGLTDTIGSEVYASPDADIVYYVSAIDGPCTDLDSLLINVYQNDKLRYATPLNYGENGPYINFGASVEAGEPHPPLNDCNTQTDWCDEFGTGEGVLGNTVWFSFKGPPLGIVSIDSKGFDNQIAIYDAKNADSLLAGNFTILAANDDYHDLEDNYAAAITKIDNLTENQVYWVQVDGSGGNLQGTFFLSLFASPLSVSNLLQPPEKENILLFPNPNNGNFTLTIQSFPTGTGLIEIFNLQGQKVLQVPLNSNSQSGEVLTSINLNKSGIFLVKISTPKWTRVKKVFIQ